MREFLREKLLAGVLVVVPVAVLVLLLKAGYEAVAGAVGPVAHALGLHSVVAGAAALLLAVAGIAVLTVLLGVAATTAVGSAIYGAAERTLLRKVPGYDLFSRVVGGLSEGDAPTPPVLVELYRPGAKVFCLRMEELADGRLVVFAPSTPAMTVGSVHVVSPDLVEALDASALDIAGIASGWGVGAGKVIDSGAAAPGDGRGAA